jgi:hypothetical protein
MSLVVYAIHNLLGGKNKKKHIYSDDFPSSPPFTGGFSYSFPLKVGDFPLVSHSFPQFFEFSRDFPSSDFGWFFAASTDELLRPISCESARQSELVSRCGLVERQ